MGVFWRLYQKPWFTSLLGVIVLGVLIWFCGPLLGLGEIHPLDSPAARVIAIVALLALWLILTLVRALQARHKEQALAAAVTAPDEASIASAAASSEEVAVLAKRFREALHTLQRARKTTRRGKAAPLRRLHLLPWYMIVGPPGAGKTTALVNSGLRFPLAETDVPDAVEGVGGTRNCDWWFTDEAVLIDTAGRYTTQDSDAAVDAAAWLGFLRLLKKHRRRQPLNGVIVAVSLSEIAHGTDAERRAHARAIRTRVRELQAELGVQLPIYVLFTKVDLIAGFVEFLDSFGREEREQVWGMTFPLDRAATAKSAPVQKFAAEFDTLLTRLNDRMLERMQSEPDVQRRRQIFGFPQQIASLRDVLAEFLADAFRPSELETPALLRGVYLTSGTQDGTPIDRLLGAMAGQFGLPRQRVAAFSGAGRSYFLTRLMREVVFAEAGLVSLDPAVERRARLVHLGAWAACAAVLALLVTGWIVSYVGNRQMIAEVHDAEHRYGDTYAALVARGPADTDLVATLPPLDTLRGMRGGYDERLRATPVALSLGLYQGAKLSRAAIDAYARALDGLLLPRLLARLEVQLRGHLDKPEFLYEAMKVYLILGRQGPLDAKTVQRWIDADLAATLPGDDDAAQRDALSDHVAAMLEQPLPAAPLDGGLIAQVRGVLNSVPVADYSYNRMLHSPRLAGLPEWSVADNAGPGAGRVFTLRSGRSLNTGVPGAFTWSGYHQVFLPLLPTVTQDIAEDRWVLGRDTGGITQRLAEVSRLRRDVLGLYLDDYTRQWDAMLADIAMKPFTSVSAGVDELSLLSAPDSPLRDLLTAIDTQTQLSRAAASDAAAGQVEAKASRIGQKAAGLAKFTAHTGLNTQQNELASILGEAFGTDPATGKAIDPAMRVDQHFHELHDFVAGHNGEPAPLEAAITKMGAMYANLNQVANAPNQGQALLGIVAGGSGAGGGGGAAAQLAAVARDMPKPIAAMLATVSESGASVAASGASQQLSDGWRSKVLPLCQAAFDRYPFIAGSSADVPLDDFSRLLGPGGLIDGFFNDNLKPFVDTSGTPWRWQAADGAKLTLSPGTLASFERAAALRDALFAPGGQMQVHFQLVPTALDPKLAQATVDIAGTVLTDTHGPTESTAFQWPGAGGKTLVRVTLLPSGGGQETVIERDGPWALLRLLDAARVLPSGQPDKFTITFSGPAGAASFTLNASSVRNPFTMAALRSFRCPPKL